MMETSNTASSVVAERDCNALGGLFQIIINDLRGGANNWDDLLIKANKYHMQLKSTINASTVFLDAFQKIADMATTTRSGTKEIGSALTRLCLRHRSVEAKLKSLTSSMLDSFILPLQDRVEEWKRIISQLDKDHSKELKRLKQFRKKHGNDSRPVSGFTNTTFRIKRNPRNKSKTDFPRIGSMYEMNKMLESIDYKEKYFMLEEVERNYVRRALIEERSHYCLFFNSLRPVIEEEISMLQEITHLEEMVAALVDLTIDPYKLPAASESLLTSLQLNDSVSLDLTFTEMDSPRSTLYRSRKSSISSINSINSLSTESISLQNCKSLSQPNITPEFRPKSIASQDSGFISHDYNVPNFGRLTISNRSKSSSENGNNICNNMFVNKNILERQSVVCPSSAKSSFEEKNSSQDICLNQLSSCGTYLDDDYVCAEQIYSVSHVSNSPSEQTLVKQPIYVNLPEAYSSSSNGFYSVNASDGSITPTNQENSSYVYESNNSMPSSRPNSNYDCNNDYRELSLKSRNAKPCPPKPPKRQSSTLSHPDRISVKSMSNQPAKSSTRIYVVQPDNKSNSLDFPPPPPEAYVDYATLSEAQRSDQVNNNHTNSNHSNQITDTAILSCCQYSIPSTQLVFCDDINCLKGISQYDSRKSVVCTEGNYQAYCASHYGQSVRKSYAFEACNANESVFTSKAPHAISNHTIQACSDADTVRSTSGRRFHSTINLTNQH